MIEKFNKLDNSKKIPIIISVGIILIVLVIVLSLGLKGTNTSLVKENSKKAFVYTIDSKKNGDYFIDVPYVNIKGTSIKSINEDINSYVENFIDKDMVRLSYEFEINGKVLSLVIMAADYDTEDVPSIYFKTYNISLDTRDLLNDEDLLSAYDFSYDDVNASIEKKFEAWYEELKEEYFDEDECDYDCFLKYRDIGSYINDVNYYVKDGNLIAYKPFVFYSIFGEDYYFKDTDYKFEINK